MAPQCPIAGPLRYRIEDGSCYRERLGMIPGIPGAGERSWSTLSEDSRVPSQDR